tara:strand:+ start:371 stop:661 length:291 start_codon:yes stop_codon:yes gene_type:complete
MRKDRLNAKKKSYKLSKKHVDMIRSQKGKMSVRQICEWFKKKTHNVYRVSPSTVSRILNNKIHVPDEDKTSIYDIIEAAQSGDISLEDIEANKVKY